MRFETFEKKFNEGMKFRYVHFKSGGTPYNIDWINQWIEEEKEGGFKGLVTVCIEEPVDVKKREKRIKEAEEEESREAELKSLFKMSFAFSRTLKDWLTIQTMVWVVDKQHRILKRIDGGIAFYSKISQREVDSLESEYHNVKDKKRN